MANDPYGWLNTALSEEATVGTPALHFSDPQISDYSEQCSSYDVARHSAPAKSKLVQAPEAMPLQPPCGQPGELEPPVSHLVGLPCACIPQSELPALPGELVTNKPSPSAPSVATSGLAWEVDPSDRTGLPRDASISGKGSSGQKLMSVSEQLKLQLGNIAVDMQSLQAALQHRITKAEEAEKNLRRVRAQPAILDFYRQALLMSFAELERVTSCLTDPRLVTSFGQDSRSGLAADAFQQFQFDVTHYVEHLRACVEGIQLTVDTLKQGIQGCGRV